jgi:hypothetical protein
METPSPAPDEIEFTDAMIAAGVRVFLAFDGRFENASDCVAEIFQAMWEAKVSR